MIAFRSRSPRLVVSIALFVAAWIQSPAASLYWDIDNATIQSGSSTPSALWDATTANWSTSPFGLPGTNGVFSNGNTAVFSAGTDATGSYSITVQPGYTPSLTGLDFQSGHVNLKPTADINAATAPANTSVEVITLTGTPTVNVQNMDSTISTRIQGGVGLTKNGVGKLTLDYGRVSGSYFSLGDNQTLTINGGTVELAGTVSGDAMRIGTILINSGATFRYMATNSIQNNALLDVQTGGSLFVNTSDYVGSIRGGGQIALTSGGNLKLGLATSTVFSGQITGAGSLTFRGASGTISLTNINSFTGSVITGGSTADDTATRSSTGGIVLGHKRAAQLATLNPVATNIAGTSIRFADLPEKTFVVGGLSAVSDQTALNSILLQDTGGNAITLQVGNSNLAAQTYSGLLTGTGGLTKIGTGTLTLTGHYNTTTQVSTSHSYTGDTTVNAATANSISAGSAFSTSTLTLNFNTTVVSPSSNIINADSRLVMGGGQLLMQGRNNVATSQTFDGTMLNSGASRITVTAGTGTSPTVLNLGAFAPRTVKGGLVVFALPTGTQSATNGVTTTTGNTNGILGSWATIGNDWATAVSNGTNNNIVAYTGYNVLTGAAPVLASDPTANIKADATSTGNITLGTGTTDINTLQITSTSRTVDISAGNTLRLGQAGGIWQINGTTGTTLIGTVADVGTLTAGGAANTDGEMVLTGNMTVYSKITDNGTGKVTLVKGTTGELILFGNNTYTGGTVITLGRVTNRTATALGTGDVTIMPGGQLYMNANVANNFIISGTGSGEAVVPGAIRMNSSTISGTITLAGDAVLGSHTSTNFGNNVLSGKITGDYQLGISAGNDAGGRFSLRNSANDFTGGLNINGINGIASALTSKNVTLRIDGSEVIPNGLGKGDVIITGGTATGIYATLDLFGNNETINGLVSAGTAANTRIVNDSTTADATLTLGDNHATASFGGIIIDGTRKVGITKIGEGAQTLSGANTYSGATTVNKGILRAGATNTFSPNSAVSLATDPTGMLDLADYSQTILSLSGGGTVNLGTAAATPAAGAILTTGSTADTTFSGIIVGAGGLKKQGSGRFTLSGVNTYLGSTEVSAGNLQVGVAGIGQTGSGAIAVQAGAILSGTGLIRGATTISGTLRPGDNGGSGIGTLTLGDLTTGSLTLTGGASLASPRLELTLAGATGNEAIVSDGIQTAAYLNGTPGNHDHVDVAGTLTLSAGSIIKVTLSSGFNPILGDVFNLMDWGTLSGGSSAIVAGGFNPTTDLDLELSADMLANGWRWETNQFLTDGIIYVVVPEPGRAMLLIGGLMILGFRRRRIAAH